MLHSLGAGITANCPGPKGSAGYGNPCALQVLEEGLVRGPTVSGGALQLGAPNTLDSLGNPIFRICLTNAPRRTNVSECPSDSSSVVESQPTPGQRESPMNATRLRNTGIVEGAAIHSFHPPSGAKSMDQLRQRGAQHGSR